MGQERWREEDETEKPKLAAALKVLAKGALKQEFWFASGAAGPIFSLLGFPSRNPPGRRKLPGCFRICHVMNLGHSFLRSSGACVQNGHYHPLQGK